MDADPLSLDQPRLAGLAAASVRGLDGDGHHPTRRGDRIDPDDLSESAIPLCAAAKGFTLHAGVAVPPSDRRRLERLCRYVARPPLIPAPRAHLVRYHDILDCLGLPSRPPPLGPPRYIPEDPDHAPADW